MEREFCSALAVRDQLQMNRHDEQFNQSSSRSVHTSILNGQTWKTMAQTPFHHGCGTTAANTRLTSSCSKAGA